MAGDLIESVFVSLCVCVCVCVCVNREKDQRLFQWQMAAIPSGVMSKIPVVWYQADMFPCVGEHCGCILLTKEVCLYEL